MSSTYFTVCISFIVNTSTGFCELFQLAQQSFLGFFIWRYYFTLSRTSRQTAKMQKYFIISYYETKVFILVKSFKREFHFIHEWTAASKFLQIPQRHRMGHKLLSKWSWNAYLSITSRSTIIRVYVTMLYEYIQVPDIVLNHSLRFLALLVK